MRSDSSGPKPVILICANKVDLKKGKPNDNADEYDMFVDDYEAKLWADVHGFTYCETSALNGKTYFLKLFF